MLSGKTVFLEENMELVVIVKNEKYLGPRSSKRSVDVDVGSPRTEKNVGPTPFQGIE